MGVAQEVKRLGTIDRLQYMDRENLFGEPGRDEQKDYNFNLPPSYVQRPQKFRRPAVSVQAGPPAKAA